MWLSTIHARGRINLDTILILLGISSLPLHIQRQFLHFCLLCLSTGSANLIPFTFCCRFSCTDPWDSFLSSVGRQDIEATQVPVGCYWGYSLTISLGLGDEEQQMTLVQLRVAKIFFFLHHNQGSLSLFCIALLLLTRRGDTSEKVCLASSKYTSFLFCFFSLIIMILGWFSYHDQLVLLYFVGGSCYALKYETF